MVMGTALSLKTGRKLPEMPRPDLENNLVTYVNISLDIREILLINSKSMEIEITALVNQKWTDSRLNANEGTPKMAVAGQIWRPKIKSINGKDVLCDDENSVFWRGYGDECLVVLNEKMVLRTFCTTDFRNFPFDSQICELKFGSCICGQNCIKKKLHWIGFPDRFPIEEVEVKWDDLPVEIQIKTDITEFELTNVSTVSYVDVRQTGNFSVASIQLVLHRHSIHYIFCTIMPCIILAMLNYLAIWLSLHKRNLRYQLTISCFLFLLFFYYVSASTSTGFTLKALEIFVMICMIFSAFTILENFVVDNLCDIEENEFHMKKTACKWEYPGSVVWLETFLRLTYPVLFVFFLFVYFLIFLS